MKKLITTYVFLMLITGIFAQVEFTVDGIRYNETLSTTSTKTVTVASGGTYTGSVTLPSTVIYLGETYNVTSIGSSAFFNCTGLTSISIPSSVTSIGDNAFIYCSKLTSIAIPSLVTSIGSSVFSGCTVLTSITIPNLVTSIGFKAFYNCTGLTSFTIPTSVTSIGDWAFYNCSGLTSITIPNSVTSIGSSAFYNCSGLTSIIIPSSVTLIESSTFLNCSGLTSITIPNSITSIGEHAFVGCSGLTSICIPSSVIVIVNGAFSGCRGLTSITIPNSVISIRTGAFSSCSSLTSIYANSSTPVNLSGESEVFYDVNKTTCKLYVPTGSKAAYQVANQWKDFTNIIEMTTTAVPKVNKLNLSVSPNSAKGFIEIKGLESSANLSVYNLQGREMLTRTIIPNEIISINSFSKGLYIVKVNSRDGLLDAKLIKE